jgi:flagellin
MTVINTNVGALTARTYALKANESMQKSMERLSSGQRINSAADDAAGLAVANKMESQLRGMNVAIRNSQDGISLVQTAEAGMGEITNMIIRMRELSVQMNNGVYTDSDRANAQLEVTALLNEIDKIATNTAFNDVKVLDGSYQTDIRAGNTNAETIGVSIKRMNTDSLGGNTIAQDVVSIASNEVITANNGVKNGLDRAAEKTEAKTSITVVADTAAVNATGTAVSINQFGSEMDSFVSTYSANASYELKAKDGTAVLASSPFYNSISASTGKIQANVNFDAEDSSKNIHEFQVVYTGRDSNGVEKSFKDNITIEIKANTTDAAIKSATTLITKPEGAIKIQAADSKEMNAGKTAALNSGLLSRELSAFIKADSHSGSFEVAQTKDNQDNKFTVDNTKDVAGTYTFGSITANLDFDNPNDIYASGGVGANDGVYEIDLVYTSASGDKFTETVKITTTDDTGDDSRLASALAVEDYTSTTLTIASLAVGNAAVAVDLTNSSDLAKVISSTMKTFVDSDTGTGTWSVGTIAASKMDITGGTTLNIKTAIANGDVYDITYTSSEGVAFTEEVTLTAVDKTAAFSTNSANGAGTDVAIASDDTTSSYTKGIEVTGDSGETVSIDLTAVTSIQANITAKSGTMSYTKAATATYGKLADGTALTGATLTAEYNKIAINGTDIDIDGDIKAGKYVFNVTSADSGGNDEVTTFVITVAERANSVTAQTVATGDVTSSTAGTATTVLGGAISTRSPDEVIAASSAITLVEAPKVQFDKNVLSASLRNFAAAEAHEGGKYSLSGTDASKFAISADGVVTSRAYMDYEGAQNTFALNVVYTDRDGNAFTEAVALSLSNSDKDSGTHIGDVDVSSQEGAATSVAILDTALNQISASQAELGAIQNRLQHNIDNLSMGSMLTETARGRIVDADFAAETSELSKQQILSQAATSMLAQANQSKQSVLALLQ